MYRPPTALVHRLMGLNVAVTLRNRDLAESQYWIQLGPPESSTRKHIPHQMPVPAQVHSPLQDGEVFQIPTCSQVVVSITIRKHRIHDSTSMKIKDR